VNPILQFAYCPRCGSTRVLARESRFHECPACGFVLYQNIATATALILECRGRLLVTVRKNDPGRDLLGLPGGFVDPGESAEAALRRELQEEVGLELKNMCYFCSFPNLYPYKGVTYHTLDLFFTAALEEEPALDPQDDVKDVRWLARAEIDLGRFAFTSMRQALAAYLAGPGESATTEPRDARSAFQSTGIGS